MISKICATMALLALLLRCSNCGIVTPANIALFQSQNTYLSMPQNSDKPYSSQAYSLSFIGALAASNLSVVGGFSELTFSQISMSQLQASLVKANATTVTINVSTLNLPRNLVYVKMMIVAFVPPSAHLISGFLTLAGCNNLSQTQANSCAVSLVLPYPENVPMSNLTMINSGHWISGFTSNSTVFSSQVTLLVNITEANHTHAVFRANLSKEFISVTVSYIITDHQTPNFVFMMIRMTHNDSKNYSITLAPPITKTSLYGLSALTAYQITTTTTTTNTTSGSTNTASSSGTGTAGTSSTGSTSPAGTSSYSSTSTTSTGTQSNSYLNMTLAYDEANSINLFTVSTNALAYLTTILSAIAPNCETGTYLQLNRCVTQCSPAFLLVNGMYCSPLINPPAQSSWNTTNTPSSAQNSTAVTTNTTRNTTTDNTTNTPTNTSNSTQNTTTNTSSSTSNENTTQTPGQPTPPPEQPSPPPPEQPTPIINYTDPEPVILPTQEQPVFVECPPSCSSCKIDNICQSCPSNMFLDNGACVCYKGYYWSNSTFTCEKCTQEACQSLFNYTMISSIDKVTTLKVTLTFSSSNFRFRHGSLSDLLTLKMSNNTLTFTVKSPATTKTGRLLSTSDQETTYVVQADITGTTPGFVTASLQEDSVIYDSSMSLYKTDQIYTLKVKPYVYSEVQTKVAQRSSKSISKVGSGITYMMILSPIIASRVNLFSFLRIGSELFLMRFVNGQFSSLFMCSLEGLFELRATDFISPLGLDLTNYIPKSGIDTANYENANVVTFLKETDFLRNTCNSLSSLFCQLLFFELALVIGQFVPLKFVKQQVENMRQDRAVYYFSFISNQIVFTIFCACIQISLPVNTDVLWHSGYFQNILALFVLFGLTMCPAVLIVISNKLISIRKIGEIIPKKASYSALKLKIVVFVHYLEMVVVPVCIGMSSDPIYQVCPIVFYLLVKIFIIHKNLKKIELFTHLMMVAMWSLFPLSQYITFEQDYFGITAMGLLIATLAFNLLANLKGSYINMIKMLRKDPGKEVIKVVVDPRIRKQQASKKSRPRRNGRRIGKVQEVDPDFTKVALFKQTTSTFDKGAKQSLNLCDVTIN